MASHGIARLEPRTWAQGIRWIAKKKNREYEGPRARRLGAGTPKVCHNYRGSVLDMHRKRFCHSPPRPHIVTWEKREGCQCTHYSRGSKHLFNYRKLSLARITLPAGLLLPEPTGGCHASSRPKVAIIAMA
jgi:hypothetical protein